MCTVSYVPGEKGYTLTFNRDEDPSRMAEPPRRIFLDNGTTITAPIDSFKGGTWIAIDDKGRAVCLLNGAFFKHIRRSQYRTSRGNLVIAAFRFFDFEDFLSSIFLDDIEPFTLLLIEPQKIQKLVWDGNKKYIVQLPNHLVHLWSSATLYTSKDHVNKHRFFMNALENIGSGSGEILRIHGKETNTPFLIDRPHVKTVSIVQFNYEGESSSLTYVSKE